MLSSSSPRTILNNLRGITMVISCPRPYENIVIILLISSLLNQLQEEIDTGFDLTPLMFEHTALMTGVS